MPAILSIAPGAPEPVAKAHEAVARLAAELDVARAEVHSRSAAWMPPSPRTARPTPPPSAATPPPPIQGTPPPMWHALPSRPHSAARPRSRTPTGTPAATWPPPSWPRAGIGPSRWGACPRDGREAAGRRRYPRGRRYRLVQRDPWGKLGGRHRGGWQRKRHAAARPSSKYPGARHRPPHPWRPPPGCRSIHRRDAGDGDARRQRQAKWHAACTCDHRRGDRIHAAAGLEARRLRRLAAPRAATGPTPNRRPALMRAPGTGTREPGAPWPLRAAPVIGAHPAGSSGPPGRRRRARCRLEGRPAAAPARARDGRDGPPRCRSGKASQPAPPATIARPLRGAADSSAGGARLSRLGILHIRG